ncbi:MAG: hypothetical protein KGO96_06485 [Elusimicrobia bacterium]|nr:hypothetical protein [Elusimicrobiota bacterium]MDE2425538.1 hypothetical protein [Elusimicrobiota bacterium]
MLQRDRILSIALPAATSLALAACAFRQAAPASASASAPASTTATPADAVTAPTPVKKIARSRTPRTRGTTAQSTRALWGIVVSLDARTGRLTIKNKHGRIHSLSVSTRTSVTEGGADKAISLAGVKLGDSVIVRASGDAARSIHVRVLPMHRHNVVAKAR